MYTSLAGTLVFMIIAGCFLEVRCCASFPLGCCMLTCSICEPLLWRILLCPCSPSVSHTDLLVGMCKKGIPIADDSVVGNSLGC